jgi:ribonuclease HI
MLTPQPKPLRILVQNCGSIRSPARHSALQQELDYQPPNILFLSETRAHNHIITTHFKNTTRNVHCSYDSKFPYGSGVAIILPKWMGVLSHQLQGVAGYLLPVIIHSAIKIMLISVYWPHLLSRQRFHQASQNSDLSPDHIHSEILLCTRKLLEKASALQIQVIIAGDFNGIPGPGYTVVDHHLHNSISNFHKLLQEFGLHTEPPSPENFTYPSTSPGAQLDFVYLTSQLRARQMHFHISKNPHSLFDHRSLEVVINFAQITSRKILRRVEKSQRLAIPVQYDTTKTDEGGIYQFGKKASRSLARLIRRNTIFSSSTDVDDKWEWFVKSIRRAAKLHLAQKTFQPQRDLIRITFLSPILSTIRAKLHDHSLGNLQHLTRALETMVQDNSSPTSRNSPELQITFPYTSECLARHTLVYADLLQIRAELLKIHCKIIHINVRKFYKKRSEIFDTQVYKKPRHGIRTALGRFLPSISLLYAIDNNGYVRLSPNAVKECLRNQAAALYPPPMIRFAVSSLPKTWKEEFAVSTFNKDKLANVWKPLSRNEFDLMLKYQPGNKAPGPSGITINMIRSSGNFTIRYLFKLFKLIHSAQALPSKWTIAKLIFIPKKQESVYAGEIKGLRPITLLESVSKLFWKLVFSRIVDKTVQHNLLEGANTSVLPGTSTFASTLSLSLTLQDAKTRKKELHIYLEDKSSAYDSITYELLEAAMIRHGIPSNFVQFYMKEYILRRQLFVCTPVGNTQVFNPARGIPQGGVECPFLWILVYDPVICKIRKLNLGYTIVARRKSPAVPLLTSFSDYNLFSLPINYFTFMDDVGTTAATRDQLQKTVDLLMAYNRLAELKTQPAKSVYVAINTKSLDPSELTPQCLKTPYGDVHCTAPSTVHRLLGAYFSAKQGLSESISHAYAKLYEGTKKLSRITLAPRRLSYMVKSVLAMSAAYQAQFAPASQNQTLSFDRTVRRVWREHLRLPRDTPRWFFHSTSMLNQPEWDQLSLTAGFGTLLVSLQPGSPIRDLAVMAILQTATYSGLSINPLSRGISDEYHPYKVGEPIAYTWGRIAALRSIRLPFLEVREQNTLIPNKFSGTADYFATTDSNFARKLNSVVQATRLSRSNKIHPPPRLFTSPSLRGVQIQGGHEAVYDSGRRPVYRTSWGLFFGQYAVDQGEKRLTLVVHLVPAISKNRWGICRSQSCPFRMMHTGATTCCFRVDTHGCEDAVFAVVGRIGKSVRIPGSWQTLGITSPMQWIAGIEQKIQAMGRQGLSESFLPPNQAISGLDISNYFSNTRRDHLDSNTRLNVVSQSTQVFFTDGSLINSGSSEVSMGAAALNFEKGFSISAKLPPGPASSMRAELWGLLLALASSDQASEVTIFTDSKSMVEASKMALRDDLSPRTRLRCACPREWSAVRRIIKDRHLQVHLNWVKGHCGNPQNDAADHLAGRAATYAVPAFMSPAFTQRQDILLPFVRDTEINCDFATEFKHSVAAKHDAALALHAARLWHPNPADLTWTMIKQAMCLPESQSSINRFRFVARAVVNLLPTETVQRIRDGLAGPTFCSLCQGNIPLVQEHALCCPSTDLQDTGQARLKALTNLTANSDNALVCAMICAIPSVNLVQARDSSGFDRPTDPELKTETLLARAKLLQVYLLGRWCAYTAATGGTSFFSQDRQVNRSNCFRTRLCTLCGSNQVGCCPPGQEDSILFSTASWSRRDTLRGLHPTASPPTLLHFRRALAEARRQSD